jgi:methanogenic corrinoid protein MtbC1
MTDTGHHCATTLTSGFALERAERVSFGLDAVEAAVNGSASTAQSGAQRRVAVLARALETEVIPRLVLSRQHGMTSAAPGAPVPQPADVAALVELAMRGDLAGAMALVATLRARDVPLERIYLDLLAPTAHRLGEMWLEDRCDFTTVTIGLCCLQQLVLENHHAFGPRHGQSGAARRVLLAPVPGEQHSFGLLMVSEFFRRQGWEVSSGSGTSARELVAMVRRQWFAVVGFTMSTDTRLDSLAALIRDVRRASRNPNIGILVGGNAFIERPELAGLVGADATAVDGQQAVLKAETLLALLLVET